jgi:hypothetical protein
MECTWDILKMWLRAVGSKGSTSSDAFLPEDGSKAGFRNVVINYKLQDGQRPTKLDSESDTKLHSGNLNVRHTDGRIILKNYTQDERNCICRYRTRQSIFEVVNPVTTSQERPCSVDGRVLYLWRWTVLFGECYVLVYWSAGSWYSDSARSAPRRCSCTNCTAVIRVQNRNRYFCCGTVLAPPTSASAHSVPRWGQMATVSSRKPDVVRWR